MKDIFTKIIKEHHWMEVPCGSGSTLNYTAPLRESLPALLSKHNINSMLDLPCGDYSWMSLVKFPSGFQYIGADIVEFMIEDNQKKYPGKDFRVLDLCQDPLPSADVLFCRDCLFHLSYQDIQRAFENIKSSNIKYLLTTTYDEQYNKDIVTGDFRPINLCTHPFDLPQPIERISDWIHGHQPRFLALWSIDTIR